MIKDKKHRKALLTIPGHQRALFVSAIHSSMSLPLSKGHALDELRDLAEALIVVINKLNKEIESILEYLKTFEV